jgi:hypothetical protein
MAVIFNIEVATNMHGIESSKNQHQKNPESIMVVSGLPRSGTSMMMKMLAAGGLEVLSDQIRIADRDNPGGYYEFEPVKQLKEGVVDWLPKAFGKTVKVIATLLPYLPPQYEYKVIFMQRALPEILASQRTMLVARGKDPNMIQDDEMLRIYQIHLKNVLEWVKDQANVSFLEVSYNDILQDPIPNIERVARFLGGQLDLNAMLSVINPDLYRQRVK